MFSLSRKTLGALCLAILLLSKCGAAQDYASLVQHIYEAGKNGGMVTYLEFLDGALHQYAVAEGTDPEHLISLTFIEERWSKSGSSDIIDQWIVRVVPTLEGAHREILENNADVVEIRQLNSEDAESVVQRIMKKTGYER